MDPLSIVSGSAGLVVLCAKVGPPQARRLWANDVATRLYPLSNHSSMMLAISTATFYP